MLPVYHMQYNITHTSIQKCTVYIYTQGSKNSNSAKPVS